VGRAGLNGLLAYSDGKTVHTYQVRVGDVGFGVRMIAVEDQGRVTRSYYPHKTANSQFSLQVLLKDWDERADFMNWLSGYAQWALDPNAARTVFPFMSVSVPVRDFAQRGLPLKGYEWGAHTGMMAFSPTITFEAALSPGQPNASITVSSVVNQWSAFGSDPAIQYFYPFGTQLAASQVPQDYGQVIPPSPVPPPVLPPNVAHAESIDVSG
jgi:hypothetical protein